MEYERTIEIDAPPDVVWAILTDVERWPEWTASMREVQLTSTPPLTVGSTVRIRQPGFPAATWTVTDLEAGRAFTWTNRSPGATSTGRHAVEGRDGGSTVTLAIEQSGPLSFLLALFAGRSRRYVDLEAEGLKARAEAAAGGSPST